MMTARNTGESMQPRNINRRETARAASANASGTPLLIGSHCLTAAEDSPRGDLPRSPACRASPGGVIRPVRPEFESPQPHGLLATTGYGTSGPGPSPAKRFYIERGCG